MPTAMSEFRKASRPETLDAALCFRSFAGSIVALAVQSCVNCRQFSCPKESMELGRRPPRQTLEKANTQAVYCSWRSQVVVVVWHPVVLCCASRSASAFEYVIAACLLAGRKRARARSTELSATSSGGPPAPLDSMCSNRLCAILPAMFCM